MPGAEQFTTEQLRQMLEKAEHEAVTPVVVSAPDKPADPYAPTVWGHTEYDFTVPSGQKCRMRMLPVEDLLRGGILDRVTRLPGIVQDQIDLAEGKPPKAAGDEMPDEETINVLIDLMEVLIPMAVVQPRVYSVPKPTDLGGDAREHGRIYTDAIELTDRVAIMERAIGGLKALDAFRVRSGPAL